MAVSFFAKKIEEFLPQDAALLLKQELNIYTLADLVSHFPFRYEDRSAVSKILKLTQNQDFVLLQGKISSKKLQGQDKKRQLLATLDDGSAQIKLIWFKALDYHSRSLEVGKEYLIYGRLSQDNFGLSIAHPDYKEASKVKPSDFGLFPVYSTTAKIDAAKITQAKIRNWISLVLQKGIDRIVETLPQSLIEEQGLLSRKQAILDIHFPKNTQALAQAIKRLKFEELFFFQMQVLEVLKSPAKRESGVLIVNFELARNLISKHLPFKLTSAQNRVLKEIAQDFKTGLQMNRLVQGDVGSGKTVVAFAAMLMAVGSGYQAVMMAPTEILAAQHFETLSQYAQNLGLKAGLLTGSTRDSVRQKLLEDLSEGDLNLLVGTHALIEDRVQFHNLGICVVDEQHRFGVEQRAKLKSKPSSASPHFLLMSATPIPRTLALTAYGDLDISIMDELPAGRKPILTQHLTEASRLRFFEFVKKELQAGRQAYVVYPAIQENEELAINDLYSGFEAIEKYFAPFRAGIVHGKMRPKDKDFEMQRFKDGQTQLLCATTAIEVGVNVPNATVMVIENAERFGLAQLHQLRGRVGRGAYQSYCYLITPVKVSREVRSRLAILCQTNDGFKIADEDLKLRGPGDLSGTQQSGLINLHFTDLSKDQDFIERVRNCAASLYENDPLLELPENRPVKLKLEVLKKNKSDFSQIG
jgi:ATP-dependent DNA helicase RecG